MTAPPRIADHKRSIGELCVAGDWACVHSDLAALGNVARQIAAQIHEPLHCDLLALVDECRSAPDRATEAWAKIKQLVQGRGEHVPR